jgi:hypothetical protein
MRLYFLIYSSIKQTFLPLNSYITDLKEWIMTLTMQKVPSGDFCVEAAILTL